MIVRYHLIILSLNALRIVKITVAYFDATSIKEIPAFLAKHGPKIEKLVAHHTLGYLPLLDLCPNMTCLTLESYRVCTFIYSLFPSDIPPRSLRLTFIHKF